MLFRVWAPNAEVVDLAVGDRRSPMKKQMDGWWQLEVADASHPTQYAYVIDGGKPLPDPRSPWQPHGVDGPSCTVDHDAFKWTDAKWQAPPLSSSIIYELHVGTFSAEGTFAGAIRHLQHLADLGVGYVELMPVAQFKGERGWGYDGVDLYAPHNAYGHPDDLKRFVDACHAHGLGVIIDVVYNHLGPAGNYLNQFGPYFTDRHQTPWGWGLNYDGAQSDEVRAFFCDNAVMWLRDYHADGLRLDAVHAIIDLSAIPFLEQLATEVDQLKAHLGRHLILIAESDLNDPRVVRPWQMGGFGLDAQWSDDIHHAVHSVLTGERDGYYADFGRVRDLATAMEQPYVYAGRHSEFRQRQHGRPPTGVTGHNFVAYIQNHDQLGNRACGERMTHLVGVDRTKIGAALVLLSPFVPMLFQGEEWGASAPFQYFVDFHDDPDLAAAVTKGRRDEFAAFGWNPEEVPDPQQRDTFERSRLDWSEPERSPHAELLAWYRKLIALRKQVPCLTDGRLDLIEVEYDEQAQWIRIDRDPVTIAANFSLQPHRVGIKSGAAILLASSAQTAVEGTQLVLAAESVAVVGPHT